MPGWKEAERAWEAQKRAWKEQKREWKAQRREWRRGGGPWTNGPGGPQASERGGPVFGWRVWLLPLFLWPLFLDVLVELFTGGARGLVGALLGLGFAWAAAARMARGQAGDLQRGAILMGVAGGITAGLAAGIFVPVAVAMGFGAWAGTRLLTADLAAHEAPAPSPASPPPADDPLEGPRAQIARILAAAPHLPHAALLIEAAGAMQGVVDDLALRPARSPEARRFLNIHVDGLARIVDRLEAGAEPPPTLPALLADLAASARRLRAELREAETEALDIQVKVLSDRLRQEGL